MRTRDIEDLEKAIKYLTCGREAPEPAFVIGWLQELLLHKQELLDMKQMILLRKEVFNAPREVRTKAPLWMQRLRNRVIACLNDFLRQDPKAVGRLMSYKVPCNDTLGTVPLIRQNGKVLDFLAVINAVLGPIREGPWEGQPPIVAVQALDGERILQFSKPEAVARGVTDMRGDDD